MKKRLGVAVVAVAAGCAVIFAGCSGCNGCGNSGKKNEAAFSSNWYADTNFRYIQPTFIADGDGEAFAGREEIVYTVKQDTETAGNKSYSVEYAEGTYRTLFYAAQFDKGLIDEDLRGGYPETDVTAYCYITELTIPSVTFKFGEETKEFGTQSVRTVCYFSDVNSHLQPLYSEQYIDMASPADYQVSSLEQTYLPVWQEIKTSYKYDGSAAKTVILNSENDANPTVKNVTKLNDTDNSLIDVGGMNIAVRAMQLGPSLSQTISVYTASNGMQEYGFAGSAYTFGEDERKGYEEILDANGLYTKADDKNLATVCVTASLNKDMKGVSQKYWFAAIDNAKNNHGRATMVKMSVPLTFSLGTLNITLKEITSTLY